MDGIRRWTRDGRAIVFVSDRSGCESIARLQIEDGKPTGSPIVVTDLGRNSAIPMGFSANGSYVVTLSHAW